MIIFNLIWPEKDRISIEIPIDLPVPLPLVFSVVRKKEAKAIHSNYPDFKNFCRKMIFEELSSSYVVLGENEETVEYILNSAVTSTLKKYDNLIQMLSFTDQKKPYKLVLKVDMVVPKAYLNNPKEFNSIIRMLLSLVDHITHYKMSQSCRIQAEKDRQVIENLKAKETQKERNEEIQKKLQEKKKEESSKKKDDDKQLQKSKEKDAKKIC